MPKVAVILAGCGRMDGSEVHESTLALLYLAQNGAKYQCFGPDESQKQVVNHITGAEQGEVRNQMVEAARIARGDIKPLNLARMKDFDAVVVPGGSGGFENLSDGPGDVHPELRRLLEEAHDLKKPIGVICIAPMLAARALGKHGIKLTIGNDTETAAKIDELGAQHVPCPVNECVADEEHRVVSAPAYMLGPGIADVAAGIEACITKLVGWCA